MRNIHWLGLGLSSYPAIKLLARKPYRDARLRGIYVRNPQKGETTVRELLGPTQFPEIFSLSELTHNLEPDDIVVSMLPATEHVKIARICLEKNSHLVTTSYISDAMRTLHETAKARDLTFLNECGLDPGLDHLFAHQLIEENAAEIEELLLDPSRKIEFDSWCGGFPAFQDPFCYRFSWSPLGALTALKNSAQWLEGGKWLRNDFAPDVLRKVSIAEELFEMYPNRDSEKYLPFYFSEKLRPRIAHFLRGTLRPNGWHRAWEPIFEKIKTASPDQLSALAQNLSTKYLYQPLEEDQVILFVEIRVTDAAGNSIFHRDKILRGKGQFPHDSAMATFVSYPAMAGVLSLIAGDLPTGVQIIPSQGAAARSYEKNLATLIPSMSH